ncbi:Alpha/Beta hydrolase protein [Rhodocollybia butyracea]|uniref:Carboxylic ester hydrolase n=1 Tax=Rhodocollybia butyracea TaxID=206335 RepID=A0A9P5P6U4_9AGAR|nr:Alpha/Beta hydrolase protein [Rhodocollybia butyracea]
MLLPFALILVVLLKVVNANAQSSVTITTTSGRLQGIEGDGVTSFKGVRFGQPPTGSQRWTPPVAFVSNSTQNAKVLGPACVQQFPFAVAALNELLFNNPQDPPTEDEDCLFLNVWAPSTKPTNTTSSLKPVVFWIYGGALVFGTGSVPLYDGMSLASNQDIVVVTSNYRTNVFGFPGAPDLPLQENNLGFMDQELALQWVRSNIQAFGGDPDRITLMGQSAGAVSVAEFVSRHPIDPPFRAAILFSGATPNSAPFSPTAFGPFNDFSTALNCTQPPGAERLACLKALSADVIRAYTNGPTSGIFGAVVDNVTSFDDNLNRILLNSTARVPQLVGNTQNDGTLFTVGQSNLSAFLDSFDLGGIISPDTVRALYPGQNDTNVIADAYRDIVFLCPASLWTQAFVQSGISSVFRYEYGQLSYAFCTYSSYITINLPIGAVFPDLQVFPNAGAFHASDLQEVFGTYNASTATANEITLSKTYQTAIANFIKNPDQSPAPNWPKYLPGNNTKTLARLAYNGNVDTGNFVQAEKSNSQDSPCTELWNIFLV